MLDPLCRVFSRVFIPLREGTGLVNFFFWFVRCGSPHVSLPFDEYKSRGREVVRDRRKLV